MNIEIVGRTNVRLLKNIAAIVERVVKRDCGLYWRDRKLSPRVLLLGIYVCYHNACKRARDMEKHAQQQIEYCKTLRKEIERLKEFEKAVVYAGYSAIITTYHWSCGDGCCSDSWAHYKVINQFGVCEKDTGEYHGMSENSYRDRWRVEEELKETYGSQIKISHDDDYSGQEHERY
jgi:hypothetical protein